MSGARISEGDRVTLRTCEREDVGFLQRANANPGLRYPLGTTPRSRGELADSLGGRDEFVVCLDADDADPGQPDEDDVRPIGFAGVKDADWRRPEVTYWLVPEVHGEGYGTETVSLVVDYAFRVYDHPAVGAKVLHTNEASRRVLESLGFEEEGRIRKDRFNDGAYADTVLYGLLREEWRERS